MDIKWKDGNGNILNANKDRIIYLDSETGVKTFLRKEEVKKITIDDGMMNIFRDFENDLAITIVIPSKHKRNAVKIFNEYDKTGTMLKRNSNDFLLNFFMDLIFESSLTLFSPFAGVTIFLVIGAIMLLVVTIIIQSIFGELGLIFIRIIIIGYPIYSVVSYVSTRIKRKRMKEKNNVLE